MGNTDAAITSASLSDYYAAEKQPPVEPTINRKTRRHEKALMRRAEKKR